MKPKRLIFLSVGLVVLLAIVAWLAPQRWFDPSALPFSTKGFTSTTLPTSGPASTSFKDQFSFKLWNLMPWYQRIHPKPNNWTFGVSSGRCSIHGLLNQCMEVSGNRYLIDPDVASGGVLFTNSTPLNGSQWVAAFEQALRTGQVEWWDQKAQKMRNENVALLHYPDQKTIVVLPISHAAEFVQKYPTNKLN